MPEYAAITIGTVDALMSSHIRQVSQQRVHAVILLLHIIKVFCVSINRVAPEYPLQQQEGVEVFMLPVRCIIEHAHIGVDHLVVPDEKQGRCEYRFILVPDRLLGFLGEPL